MKNILRKKLFLFIVSLGLVVSPACAFLKSGNKMQNKLEHLNSHIEILYQMAIQDKKQITRTKASELRNLLYGSNEKSNLAFYDYENHFTHPLLLECIEKIAEKKSINPLFHAWDDFKFYFGRDAHQDKQFLKECCQLVFVIYNQSLCHLTDCGATRVDLSDVRDLYVIIATLPIGKMLILLDKISVGLAAAMAEYNQPSDGGFFGWIQKNWWIPPTVIAGVITAIVLGKSEQLLINQQGQGILETK